MEDFAKKVSISEPETAAKSINMETQAEENQEKGSKFNTTNEAILGLLRRFLAVQQRRAIAYARLKRYSSSLPNFSSIARSLCPRKWYTIHLWGWMSRYVSEKEIELVFFPISGSVL